MNGLTDRLKQGLTGKNRDRTGPVLNGNAVLSVPVQPIFDPGTSLVHVSGAFSLNASTLLSACSRRAGRSFVDSSGCLDESSVPASFLQQTFTDNKAPRQHRRGRRRKTRHRVLTRTLLMSKDNLGVKRTTIPSRRIQHLTTCSNIQSNTLLAGI